MLTGKINDLMQEIVTKVTLAETAKTVPVVKEGNPLQGECLQISWAEIWDRGLDYHICLPREAFIDCLEISFGKETKLFCVTLIDEKHQKVLYQYRAENGKCITESCITLEAGRSTDSLIVRLDADYSDVELSNVVMYGALEDGPELFPTPNSIHCGEEFYEVSAYTGWQSDCELAKNAGRLLSEKWQEETGNLMQESEHGNILFLYDAQVKENGYRLSVTREEIHITASDIRGFVMGVETLIKMINTGHLQQCDVSDSPVLQFRGIHIFVPSEEQMEFAKRFIKYLVSPMGYNTVFMQVSGGMEYESHPEINQMFKKAVEDSRKGLCPPFPHDGIAGGGSTSKASVRELVDYIRSFGIEVIPEVQSLGHVQYITHAHPEVAELAEQLSETVVDTRVEDEMPDSLYPHCYCPSNEKSYEILFELLDEVLEVFRPTEYVHMGHDECNGMGVCKVCKSKDPVQLFADDVKRIYDYLKSKGLKMMIWSDMVHPVSAYPTIAALDLIPKDIILLDFIWYFHLDDDIEDYLLEKGFEVMLGNTYSSHFPRYVERSRKKGICGAQISTWVGTEPHVLAQEGKLYDYVYSAQMFWSEHYLPQYRLCYERMLHNLMPKLREQLENIHFPSRTHDAKMIKVFDGNIDFPPAMDVKRCMGFEVNQKAKSILISHTMLNRLTRKPWETPEKIGRYVFLFEDGSEEGFDIAVGENIGHWNRRQFEPLKSVTYRHNGYTNIFYCNGVESKTTDGENVCVYQVECLLPANKKLTSVTLEEYSEIMIALCSAEIVV